MTAGRSARGLFRATGKGAKPVMADLVDGAAVFVGEVEREEHDFYPTPPEPTRAILAAELPRLRDFGTVWEPAAGDGAMVREMQVVGLRVHPSDLIDRGVGAEIRSFYDYGHNDAPSRCILTNPPFAECNTGAWIRHALGCLGVRYMALLLPFGWPGAAERAGLWAQYPPARLYLMRWRIDFTGKGAPPMLNAWFVWDEPERGQTTRFLTLDRADARQGVLL